MARIKSVIRTERRSKDLTQQELADLLNVSRVAVANWEAKLTTPSVHNMLRLNAHLEISLDELMDDYNKDKDVTLSKAIGYDSKLLDKVSLNKKEV